ESRDAATTPAASQNQLANEKTLTVDFPGGTITQLVTQLSQIGGRTLNVLGDKADLATQLPPFSLRNADPAALAAALNMFLASRDLQLMQSSGHENGVYVLRGLSRPMGIEPSVFDSFQLAPYLEAQSIDDITGA